MLSFILDEAARTCCERAADAVQHMDPAAAQLSSGVINAFGIRLHSRGARCDEMIELLCFAQACAERGAGAVIEEVFYDTREGVVKFKLRQSVDQDSSDELMEIAERYFSKYRWVSGYMGGRDF